jgi:ribonuclease E
MDNRDNRESRANKMLIDATHPEETRVVVLKNGRVDEFDFESAARKLLRGNIYLAKVTRVEPSLQAAFVDYGGNRHGFLAFGEIHPDYYQIPMADRQALIEEEAAAEAEADAEADARAERRATRDAGRDDDDTEPVGEHLAPADDLSEPPAIDPHGEPPLAVSRDDGDETRSEEPPAGGEDDDHIEEIGDAATAEAPEVISGESAEPVVEEDALEEVPERPRRRMRSYKIQEVIRRRQVILVQVVKEERGNKGAALTTYLSLAGRYTVLMPNTARGGGISRKITNPQDRKRLKAIAQELEVPEGMGLIIRTAGAARTKQEIKRDFEYLLRLWESVRDMTLQSVAPSLVYEEGNLIKRSIRDLYTKDIDEIVVAGMPAYAEANDFMRMLMPSHTKNVAHYQDRAPLFSRYGIERQLNAMFSPYVTLRSGGYLVINQTEALVAIDINSGKSTREFSIEETALNTNLEAADEIARQIKLRDLAGLIVIDFIDMEEKRNNRAVERRLKDALRHDRARIQVGRISHFGLLEMSRQRMRTGVLEGSSTQCPHCQGSGAIRSTESVALAVLRGLDDHLSRDSRSSVVALTNPTVALYLLNHKRDFISEMEDRFGIAIAIEASEKMHGAAFAVEKSAAPPPTRRPERAAVNMDWGFAGDADQSEEEDAPEYAASGEIEEIIEDADEDMPRHEARGRDDQPREGREGGGRRRRRRRGRGNRDRDREPRDEFRGSNGGRPHADRTRDDEQPRSVSNDGDDGDADDEAVTADGGDQPSFEREGGRDQPRDGEGRRRRRRGRRGGRRNRERARTGDLPAREGDKPMYGAADAEPLPDSGAHELGSNGASAPDSDTTRSATAPEPEPPRPPTPWTPSTAPTAAFAAAAATHVVPPAPRPEPQPEPVRAAAASPAPVEIARADETPPDDPNRPARKGWWQRRFGG